MRNNRKSWSVTVLTLFFALPLGFAQFKPALPGYHYEFPRDYFNHPDYQTEWWYYTGNLQTTDGRKFGFELTFFRKGVNRNATNTSAWDICDLYLAHFAVSDLEGKKFFHAERSNRSGPGIAGADLALQKVWNGNWSVVWTEDRENLSAMANGFAISLSLQAQKPPVVHGANGVSQKSAGVGRASHYFSVTRLRASGSLEIASNKYAVTGLAWMDHEFFTGQFAADQIGWDWLSLQLADNTELMLFHIRRKDGAIDSFSAGTFIDAQGDAHHLGISDFRLEPSGPSRAGQIWTSPATHATYPIAWKIRVPSLGITLETSTQLPSQEFTSSSKLVPSYWEGAISAIETGSPQEVRGSGYLEMTGYSEKAKMP